MQPSRVAALSTLQLLWTTWVRGTFIPLTVLSGEASPSNTTGRIFSFSKKQTRLRVELTFAIPFLSIPVGAKKKDDALVDVNLGALGAGAVFSLAALLFIPHIFDGLRPELNFGREEERERSFSSVWSRMDSSLKERRVDAEACVQRALCSVVASSRHSIERGTGGSIDKIVDGIISNEWLINALHGTSMNEAIDKGKFGANCTVHYDACSLPDRRLQNAVEEIAKIMKN